MIFSTHLKYKENSPNKDDAYALQDFVYGFPNRQNEIHVKLLGDKFAFREHSSFYCLPT